MEAAIDQAELFQFATIEHTARKRTPLRQMLEAIAEHGPLVPLHFLPVAVELSRQRVHQLVMEGRIATVKVADKIYVPMAALDLFLTEERKNGRPIADPEIGGMYRRAWKHHSPFAKK